MAEPRMTRERQPQAPPKTPDSHASSDPSADQPLNPSPTVARNPLGDPIVPDPGNNNAETIVPGTDPYVGSAAQLGDGNLGDTDVQWPPGRIETAAGNLAVEGQGTRGIDAPGRTDPEGDHPAVSAMEGQGKG